MIKKIKKILFCSVVPKSFNIIEKYLSKKTMDEIDNILGEHYGFTKEELDFILNYDIKYRMSKEVEIDE
mgnify:CR=1 FL=1